MSKVTIIIQARTGSRRFPKKVLAKIQNKPLIWHVINRAKKVRAVQQIILATSRKKEDQTLLKIARKTNIIGYAGDEKNVLNRFYKCALEFNADPIIRITGDCPLIDPKIIEMLLCIYKKNKFNYVTNTLHPTYPDGLDIEIFSFKVLKKINEVAKLKSEREHVTPYLRKNIKKFKIYNLEYKSDLSEYRWTVDEKSDLKFVRKIYSLMKPKLIFGLPEILKVININHKLLEINQGIRRNEGYFHSIREDEV